MFDSGLRPSVLLARTPPFIMKNPQVFRKCYQLFTKGDLPIFFILTFQLLFNLFKFPIMAQVLVLLQARLSEVEGENARLKSMLKQKDEEVEGIDKVAKRLQEERGKVADIIRQEFADRFVRIIMIMTIIIIIIIIIIINN